MYFARIQHVFCANVRGSSDVIAFTAAAVAKASMELAAFRGERGGFVLFFSKKVD